LSEKSFEEITLSICLSVRSIDFGGWRPIQSAPAAPTDALLASASQPVLQEAPSAPLERHFLTVPVAVETDAEHVLSETEINQIREHVITNWKQKPEKSESFGAHVRPLVTKLLPKPEVELTVEETAPEGSHESPDRSGDEKFVYFETIY
jgi:hypothetical protein